MDRTRAGQFSKQAQKNLQRSGAIASGLLDLIPFVGAGRSAMEGDYGSAAMQGLLDVAPVGKAIGLAAAPLMGAIKAYHGSNVPIDVVDLNMFGKRSGIKQEGPAFWLSSDKDSALGYAKSSNGNVITEFDISPQNAMIVEVPVKDIISGVFEKTKIESLKEARKKGNDVVIFRQSGNGAKLLADEIAVLKTNALSKPTGLLE